MGSARPTRIATSLAALALAVGLGCNAILGLEDIDVAPSALDAGSADAIEPGFCSAAPAACGAFCRSLPSPGDAGALLYCNDFDQLEAGAPGTFGFTGQGIASGVTATLDTDRTSSAPNAYRLDVAPSSQNVANVVSMTVARSPLDLSVRFSISFDPVDGGENRTIPLVVFPIDANGAAVIFGVDEGRYFVSRANNSTFPKNSEIKAERVVVQQPLPTPEYATFVLSIGDAASCATPQPSAGPAPGDRAVFVSRPGNTGPTFLGAPIACKKLPAFAAVTETDLGFGGFIDGPPETFRWRFDDIVVRAK